MELAEDMKAVYNTDGIENCDMSALYGAKKDMTVTDDLMKAMMDKMKQPKPEGATTIYRVKWHMRSDSFSDSFARVSSASTPQRLERTKSFVSQDKAQQLVNQLTEAFKTLDYAVEGRAWIEEDYYE